MLTLSYFGIESSGLNLVIDLLILFIVVLYLSLIYWTYADARRRIMDPMLVGCATAASLFPFVGTIVYMILRPPEYLEDVRERELEVQAAEARLHEFDHSLCPHCDYRVERDFVRCPSCLRKLKERCVSCSRPLDQAWTICPYCETEVAPSAPARRTRRRRTQAAIDAEQAELATTRPETARAKAARERKEREAAPVIEADVVEEPADEQDTRATPVAATEPAPSSRSGRSGSSSRRARPST
jgi:Double zinc ribbon